MQGQMETKSADDAIKLLIQKRVKAFEPFRKSRMLEIKANIAYLCGYQNIQVINNTLKPLPQQFSINVVANRILPAVRHDIAVGTRASPTFDIVPASTDENDKATAKAAEKILPYIQRINDPHLNREAVILWYDIAGSGWRKVYWNPYFKANGYNFQESPLFNPELPEGEPIFQGEVVIEHVPNTELIFDYRTKNLRKLKWIIQHKTITLSEIREKYGLDVASKINPTVLKTEIKDADDFETDVLGSFKELSQSINSNSKQDEDFIDSDKLVNCYEFWHVIDKNMPKGAYAVALGDVDQFENFVIAVNEPYPIVSYPHGEVPFIPSDPMPLSGIAVGSIPRISLARPLQREYNRLTSMISDNIDAMGNSVLITSRDANIDYKKLDNCAANIIEVDGPYVSSVRREMGTPVSSSIFAHRDAIRNDMDEIFAFHEPSRGVMPSGGPRSAIGLQVLQERDSAQLSPIMIAMDVSDEKIVYQALCLAIANYGDRLIQVVGKDNRWTLEKIDGDELKGRMSVIVRQGSSLPVNKAIEQEKIVFAWQSQLLGNPLDPAIRNQVIKAMDLGGFDLILQGNAKHVNIAQKEFINAEKLAMQIPPLPEGTAVEQRQQLYERFLFIPLPNSFDEHYTHLQEHGNFLLDKYYEYIGSGQEHLVLLANMMNGHIMAHQQILQQQQLQAMMMQNPKAFMGQGKESNKKQ